MTQSTERLTLKEQISKVGRKQVRGVSSVWVRHPACLNQRALKMSFSENNSYWSGFILCFSSIFHCEHHVHFHYTTKRFGFSERNRQWIRMCQWSADSSNTYSRREAEERVMTQQNEKKCVLTRGAKRNQSLLILSEVVEVMKTFSERLKETDGLNHRQGKTHWSPSSLLCLSVCLSASLSVCLAICPSVCLSVHLCLIVHLSSVECN